MRELVLPPEPVSPELVLIDPELARRERARLEEKGYLQGVRDVPAIRRALERQLLPVDESIRRTPRSSDAGNIFKRRLVPAALLCSLLVNGFLMADLVAHKGDEAAHVAVRIVAPTDSAQAVLTSVASRGEPESSSTIAPSTKSAVERTVVSLILSAPAGKLPRTFIDPATGLVKNNVQVVCGGPKHRSFLCVVRLPFDRTSKALYVRYRTKKNGKGVFKWDKSGLGQRSS